MEERYRAMLMARSAEERMLMADSMYATARALVTTSILHRDPSASPAVIRQALFVRFYGHELNAATRDRILARLASADHGERRCVRKRVAVDWGELELAMTWHGEELTCFLDVRTGEVRHYRSPVFGDAKGQQSSEDEADQGLAEGYLIHIDPIESSVEYRWMADFAASVPNPRLRDRL